MHWLRLLQQVADLEEQQQLGSRMVRHPKNTFVNIYIYINTYYTHYVIISQQCFVLLCSWGTCRHQWTRLLFVETQAHKPQRKPEKG